MIKHYVEYICLGGFVSEIEKKAVAERNVKEVIIPENCFGFRFVDREEIEVNGEVLRGEYKNISGWYYQGRLMTLDDVKKEMPERNILISNMECNEWNKIVWTKFNQAIPLYKGDSVLID